MCRHLRHRLSGSQRSLLETTLPTSLPRRYCNETITNRKPMNENRTERSGRRRRGGRRRSSNRRDEPRSETRTAPAAKPTLWQKIVAFFTGKSKSNGSSASVQPARKYPAYEPRSNQQRFQDGTPETPETTR